MSRIYFHAPHRTAEVGGSERAYIQRLASDIALGVIGLNSTSYGRIKPFVRGASEEPSAPQDWLAWKSQWEARFSTDQLSFCIDNEWIPSREMSFNTLIAMNSPQLSFMAHVCGTCENHGYISEHHARWLHDVIERGRAANLFRAGQGWEDVMKLALEIDELRTGEIVMSYSVCERFPNMGAADWQGSPEEWYALPEDRQWLYATAGLMAKSLKTKGWPFAMGPDRQNQGFMSGKSAFDLMAQTWTGKLAVRQES